MLPEARGLEFLIVAAIALIVVGPKELPNLLRKLGQFVGKMRRVAADFRTSFDEMARQSELDELRKQVEEMRAQAEAAASDPVGLGDTFSDYGADVTPPVEPEPEPELVAETPAEPAPKRKRAPAKPKTEATATPAKTRAKPAASKAKSASPATTAKAKAPARKRAPKVTA